jgi:hypothetical protein
MSFEFGYGAAVKDLTRSISASHEIAIPSAVDTGDLSSKRPKDPVEISLDGNDSPSGHRSVRETVPHRKHWISIAINDLGL